MDLRYQILFAIQDKEGNNITWHDTWISALQQVKDDEVIKLEIYDSLKEVCEYISLP